MDIIIFISFSLLFPILYASAAHHCSITKCGRNEIPIRFPFNQQGKQPQSCGYPGFNLGCSQNMISLTLPYSGEFFVRDIDYVNQQLDLYDPDDCLPRRLLSFNLSGSPFLSVFHQNYTFLRCPIQVTESRFTTIDCMTNSTHSVLATTSTRLANSMVSSSCLIIDTLPIPVSWPPKHDEDFSAELDADIQLTWYTPLCGDCETQGGTCGFKNNSGDEIECYHLPNSGRTDAGLRVFRIICLSIAVPALTCAIGIALFACCQDGRHRVRENLRQRNNHSAAVLPQPTVVTGLDESTIESYEKVVLGESRRVPGPNDNTCPICLSEYISKDTIRCIPECKHCFHAECIDSWLRMNTTCPVCRNSPSPEHATSQTDLV